MADEKLVDSVKKALAEGKTVAEIKEEFSGKGFEEDHIYEALEEAQNSIQQVTETEKPAEGIAIPVENPTEPKVSKKISKKKPQKQAKSVDVDETTSEQPGLAALPVESSDSNESEPPASHESSETEVVATPEDHTVDETAPEITKDGGSSPAPSPPLLQTQTKISPGKRTLTLTVISIVGMLLSALGIAGSLAIMGYVPIDLSFMHADMLFGFIAIDSFTLGVIYMAINAIALLGCIMVFMMKKIGLILTALAGVINVLSGILPSLNGINGMITTLSIAFAWAVIVAFLVLKRGQFSKAPKKEAGV